MPTRQMMPFPETRPGQRRAVALAALVAVLHFSVLSGRLGGRMGPSRGDVLEWRASIVGPVAERSAEEQPPSNPQRTYNAGQLALNTGVAIVALTAWLQVMQINGSTGR